MGEGKGLMTHSLALSFAPLQAGADVKAAHGRTGPGSVRRLLTEIELHNGGVYQDLPGVPEIDRDPRPDHRLHLARAPVRAARMAHPLPGFDGGVGGGGHDRLRYS